MYCQAILTLIGVDIGVDRAGVAVPGTKGTEVGEVQM